MTEEKSKRAAYTLEYKQEAVRLVQGGQFWCVCGQGSGHSQADTGQLGQAGIKRQAHRRWRQAGQCRANGAVTVKGRVVTRQNGARHTKKR